MSLTSEPRQIRLIFMCAVFLLLSAAGWLRFEQTLVQWNTLQQAGVRPGPVYLAVSGLLWGAGGVLCAVALWLGWRGARQIGMWGVVLFLVSYWANRLFFTQSSSAQANWAFALVFSVFCAFIGLFILYSLKITDHRKNNGK